jgi:arylsulfatase A-like enzyme
VTLAGTLKQYGYETGAIVGSFPVSSLYGLNQGFDTYDEEFTSPTILRPPGEAATEVKKIPAPENPDDLMQSAKWADQKMHNDARRDDSEVSEHAVAWLRSHTQSPFFLWVHYFGPHERLFEGMGVHRQEPRIIASYDRDLKMTDTAIEGLLTAIKELGLEEHLLVVLHADHGQSLGEHSYVGHGVDLYESSLHIPVLIRWPGQVAAGLRIPQLVRNVDIMPTILDLVGVPVPRECKGRSLASALRGNALPAVPAYSETYTTTVLFWPVKLPDGEFTLGPTSRHSIRTGQWKLIASRLQSPCQKGPEAYLSRQVEDFDVWRLRNAVALDPEACNQLRVEELYDLTTDPAEANNVLGANPDIAERLRSLLDGASVQRGSAERMTLSPADKERLRSLGYRTGEE